MAARTRRRGDRFHIAAGLGVDEAVQPRHPVGALRPQHQAAAPRAVGFVEIAVGVEDLIDTPAGGLDDLGVVLGGLAHQAGFDLHPILGRHTRRQPVQRRGDRAQMILADRTGLDGCGDQWQFGGSSGGPASWRRGRIRAPTFIRRLISLGGMRSRAHRLSISVGHQAHLIGRIGDLGEHPIHQPAVGALLGLQPLGHLHPKLATHLIGGQLPHLGVGVIHLIGQHTKLLARRLSGNELAHATTLSNACTNFRCPDTIRRTCG